LQDRVITDNQLLIYCASNAKVITNINNLKTPSKRKSPEHIDGFVAMLIGHKETLNMMEDQVPEDEYEKYLNNIYR
ncbi:terminase large subunit, partial [Bacillus cereus]